jgi:hypothetical protein
MGHSLVFIELLVPFDDKSQCTYSEGSPFHLCICMPWILVLPLLNDILWAVERIAYNYQQRLKNLWMMCGLEADTAGSWMLHQYDFLQLMSWQREQKVVVMLWYSMMLQSPPSPPPKGTTAHGMDYWNTSDRRNYWLRFHIKIKMQIRKESRIF